MSLTLPAELEQALVAQAKQRQVPPEQIIKEALTWYLQFDAAFLDEFAAWQEIRDEALDLIENHRS